MENKIIDAEKVSEYRIGGTTYFVCTFFNSNQKESLDEIIQRLIINDSKKSSVNTDEIINSKL
ncbi:MAG: transposon-encoded TnpW family protein [Muribaculaceae bacterium]|nr:transposon-encoded TnpW family protein [Muribaculaceae bacterium]